MKQIFKYLFDLIHRKKRIEEESRKAIYEAFKEAGLLKDS